MNRTRERLRTATASPWARGALTGADRAAAPVAGLVALALIVYFLLSGSYVSSIVEDALVYAIAAMGIDFLGGYGGLVTLGQAGFLGLGAYGVAIAEAHGFGPWASIGIAVGVVIATAAVTAVVAVRVSGITYVIITLAIGQILWGLSYQWTSLTSGDNGIPLAAYPSLGPFDLGNQQVLRLTTLVVFLIVLGLLAVMVRSPFGLSLRGMKSNERRLRALGYRSALQRYLGYVVASFFGGIAGIMYVLSNNLISPSSLEFAQDGYLVLMVILGGLASIWGPVLGAFVIVLFQEEVSSYLARWQTLMGIVFIAAVIYTPGGIAGLLQAAKGALHRAAAGAARQAPRAVPGVTAQPAAGSPSGTRPGDGVAPASSPPPASPSADRGGAR